MKLNRKIYTTELDGEAVSLEISEVAHQANAAVLGKHGGTVVLATVVMGSQEKKIDYFPLTVDYEERFYAAGKIIGSRFIRREGRPSDEAILSARLIDRTIRPLFDHRFRREVQVVVTVLAYDEKNDPDPIALLAVSTALSISDVPWNGPVAGVKLQSLAPTGELVYSSFFAGPETRVNMIELEGSELLEADAVKVFETAQKEIVRLIEFQKPIIRELGKQKFQIVAFARDPRVQQLVHAHIEKDLESAMKTKTLDALKSSLMEQLTAASETPEVLSHAEELFEETVDASVHALAIERGKRVDGRALDEVRDLYAEVKLFERTHGSALFIRGDTQILAVTTLGTPSAEQLIETMETSGKKRFMLHYNFPSFSTGETGRSRGPGRREIGHGTLALKALSAVIPSKEQFPYTIRVVAETLSSNGSSSMATACSTTLSLMDAGVPIKKPVAGIAMGLMSDSKGNYKILTDIQGPEDHYGDMDCKVAGTDAGITAIQMDVKVEGITKQMFVEALEGARKARLHILKTINAALPASREQVSQYAPTIKIVSIPPDRIGEIIGPGGKVINGIIADAGGKISIDIEQDGRVFVAGIDAALVDKALATVKQIVREFHIGEIIEGNIIKILDFGAIVDLGGSRDGMIHVSELREGYVKKVEDVVRLGDHVRAKIIRAEDGKIGLSLRGVPKE